MIWIAILPLITISLVFLLWPLLRGRANRTVLDHAMMQYEERRRELARQHATGLMSEADYAAAEAEQGRSLLALKAEYDEKSNQAVPNLSTTAMTIKRRKIAAAFMLITLPLLSVALYLRLGQPSLLDRPLAQRQAEAAAVARATNVEDALTKIEAHLLKNPEDGQGFEVVAPVYMRMERFVDAAHAYGRVLDLLGETPDRLANWGESLMAAAGGVITEEAKIAFERAAMLDPTLPKAQFYIARVKEQQGDYVGAHQVYVRMLSFLPEGMGSARVREEIKRLQEEGKIPPDTTIPPPTGATADSLMRLPVDEQQKMIHAMVDGLTNRLAEKGGTYQEWIRLIQARLVLGEQDKARAHFEEATKIFKNDYPAIRYIEQMRGQVMAKTPSQEEKKQP